MTTPPVLPNTTPTRPVPTVGSLGVPDSHWSHPMMNR